MERETLEFDVVIVGAGPAGLATAIHLAKRCEEAKLSPRIAVLEKGAMPGAHILSGAVIDPSGLEELIPEWKTQGIPLETAVTRDRFCYLSPTKTYSLPIPSLMRNEGCYIASLGKICQWLANYAQNVGVQIFSGFAATELLFDNHQRVCGVATGEMGRDKEGKPTAQFQRGVKLKASYTVIAEGARGSLAKQVIQSFNLDEDSDPQTYALGFKEIWEVPAEQHQPGLVMHSVGWPLNNSTYGGSFLYHYQEDNRAKIAIGFAVGLDYKNPYLDPFCEFQRFKTHPAIKPLLMGAERIAYGARVITEGGLQSIPRCAFPGGLLVGCSAGFMNVPRLKGSHNAIKSGIAAANAIFAEFKAGKNDPLLGTYAHLLTKSAVYTELRRVRNIRPAFAYFGLIGGMLYAFIDMVLLRGRAPWTFHNKRLDHTTLSTVSEVTPIEYPKPDGVLTFDKLSSIHLANLNHSENQPCHLVLGDQKIPLKINYERYASPETRYCPAGVYEIIQDEKGNPRLQINAANCIHCKACDIKDITQNINWVPPQGGEGPNYQGM